jgi:hypothetical protein
MWGGGDLFNYLKKPFLMCNYQNELFEVQFSRLAFLSFHMQAPVFNSLAFTSLNYFTMPVDWCLITSPLPLPLPLLIPAPYPLALATPVSMWPLMPRPLWGVGLLALAARSLRWSALMEKN